MAVAGGLVLAGGLWWAAAKVHDGPSAAPPATTAPASSPPGGAASPAPSPSPSVVKPHVRWKGSVAVEGPTADRDMDQEPPRTDERFSDVTGDAIYTTLKAGSGARLAVVPGGEKPGYSDCRDAVLAGGESEVDKPKEGEVLCLLTSEQRVARLTVTEAETFGTVPSVRLAAVVWDPPVPR